MDVGDTIVVCDAGGETVGLITFTIVQLQPSFCLKEAAPGNGALCGARIPSSKTRVVRWVVRRHHGLCNAEVRNNCEKTICR